MPHTIPDPGRIDGKYGPKTEAALVAWQTLVGVDADGAWGPKTEAATAAWLDLRKLIIRSGDSGDAVRNRQRYLADRHAERPGDLSDPGRIDGKYGAKSAASTSGWQTVLDTKVDGKWGPNTWAASDRYDDEQRA
jgi:peptidoglycan hydrolase-like protein with peptidoglycan-binding domain